MLLICLKWIFGRVTIEKGVVSILLKTFANKIDIVEGAYLQSAN
jgi:hypothetical protein